MTVHKLKRSKKNEHTQIKVITKKNVIGKALKSLPTLVHALNWHYRYMIKF